MKHSSNSAHAISSTNPEIIVTENNQLSKEQNSPTSNGLLYSNGKLCYNNSKASSAKTSCSEISNFSSRASSQQELILGNALGQRTANIAAKMNSSNGLNSRNSNHCHSTTNMDCEEDIPVVAEESKSQPWSSLSCRGKLVRIRSSVFSIVSVLTLLYIFVCSLDLMGSSLKLMAGKTAGDVFTKDSLLSNPVAGLMVGVLATVLVQSSSTSTSIVVTMVASKILEVHTAIPIVMGANIGTSVTNTLVAMGQIQVKDEFKRAFAGATVHDMFNWLTVLVLLPVEVVTGYLQTASLLLVRFLNVDQKTDAEISGLDLLTDPVMKRIVIVDKSVITNVQTTNGSTSSDAPVLKRWCGDSKSLSDTIGRSLMVLSSGNETLSLAAEGQANLSMAVINESAILRVDEGGAQPQKCQALFNWLGLSDMTTGLILFVVSVVFLCTCLILLVKVLKGIFSGQMSELIKKTVNDDFPGCLGYFTGLFAIFVGTVMTILVQSSSVFTSTLTPLVGLGVIKIERVFPLTLGSNIGTTVTGLLAALAADASMRDVALQIALCHLLFNLSGILIWYPIPLMRKIPIRLAKQLGETTAEYRWFALFYLLCMFVLAPLFVFVLSLLGSKITVAVLASLISSVVLVVAINLLQKSQRFYWVLPPFLRSWQWLPKPLHSLGPWDGCFHSVWVMVKKLLCKFRRTRNNSSSTAVNNNQSTSV